jgi:GTP-binding protein
MIVLTADFEKSAPSLDDAPLADLPEVCFVGRSNVGKSSAMNALTKRRQLARVSKTPGRTRLLNFFRVELADKNGPNRRTATLRLCDLPGYGYAEAPKTERKNWGAMISRYLRDRPKLYAIVVLVDADIGAQPKDLEMMEFLADTTRPIIVAATKADRVSRTRLGSQLDKLARDLGVPRSAILPFSAHEEIGRRELWNAICTASGLLDRTRPEHILTSDEEFGRGEGSGSGDEG